MNLISCDNCGIVLDKDKLNFPEIVNDDGSLNTDKLMWINRDRYTRIVPCPVCKNSIPEKE